MDLKVPPTLADWFASQLARVSLRDDTRAYIVSVMADFRADSVLGRRESIVLAYHTAMMAGDFRQFQRLGDWALWAGVWYPENVQPYANVAETIGRFSYSACYRILRRSWPVYEELADDLPVIVQGLRDGQPWK